MKEYSWLEMNVVSGELLGRSDLCASVPDDATPEDCIRAWMDLLTTCDEFLLAGLRREIGPDGDLQEAYRRWYAEYREEHRRALVGMMQAFARSEESDAP